MRAKLAVALVVMASVSAHGTVARADGDPASDVLLGQNVYYPYAPNLVSRPVRGALDSMVARAKAVGYPVKVAIIAARADLGAYPYLFDQPQRYADLLTKEISFNTTAPVLAVLPTGIAGTTLGANSSVALRGIRPVSRGGGDALARTAMVALGRLTKAAGTPVAVPREASAGPPASEIGAGKGGGIPSLLIFGIPVALVAAVAGALTVRERRRKDTGGRGQNGSVDEG